jgi:hypothetical protein
MRANACVLVIVLAVVVARSAPDTPALAPTPLFQSAGSTPAQSPGTVNPTLRAAVATALPTPLAGATAGPSTVSDNAASGTGADEWTGDGYACTKGVDTLTCWAVGSSAWYRRSVMTSQSRIDQFTQSL